MSWHVFIVVKDMSLPKEIVPNPLVTSAVELRFTSDISRDDLLDRVYRHFATELPKISEANSLNDFKVSEDNFRHGPEYILSNDKYSMAFSTHMVSFENVNEYQLWDNYFDFIKRQLSIFSTLGIIGSIQRIGVRYASIFPGIEHPKECLKVYPTTIVNNDNNISEKLMSFTASYFNDKFATLFLQIYPNVVATRNENSKVGFMIDIDAFNTEIHEGISDGLFQIIDILHTKEKDFLFKNLLSSDFLKSLNVTY